MLAPSVSWFLNMAEAPSAGEPVDKAVAILAQKALASGPDALRTLPWRVEDGHPLAPPVLDFNWLVAQPLLPYLVQVIPPHTLYRSLRSEGFSDSIEVVEWIRGRQLIQVLDYDLWSWNPELSCDDLSKERVLEWFRVWLEVGESFAAERIFELEEEIIILALTAVLEIIPEGLSTISDAVRDEYWPTLDRQFLLKVKSPDPEAFEIVKQVIDGMYAKDVKLTQSALAHAAMLVRQEALFDAERWRQGRLADQGFVAREDAREILAFRKPTTILKQILQKMDQKSSPKQDQSRITMPDPEILAALEAIIGAYDSAQMEQEVVRLIGSSKLLELTGIENVGQAILTDEGKVIEAAALQAYQQCSALLARMDASESARAKLKKRLLDEVFQWISRDKPEELGFLKARVARIANTVAGGFARSFDNDILSRCLAVTRGSLNLGLEYLLQEGARNQVVNSAHPDPVAQGQEWLDKVGPELIFQLGWNLTLELSKSAIDKLEELALSGRAEFKFLRYSVTVTLDDGTKLDLSPAKLWTSGRFSELQTWLESLEHELTLPALLALKAVCNRIPLFAELLSDDDVTDPVPGSIDTSCRGFETLKDRQLVMDFLENLDRVIIP